MYVHVNTCRYIRYIYMYYSTLHCTCMQYLLLEYREVLRFYQILTLFLGMMSNARAVAMQFSQYFGLCCLGNRLHGDSLCQWRHNLPQLQGHAKIWGKVQSSKPQGFWPTFLSLSECPCVCERRVFDESWYFIFHCHGQTHSRVWRSPAARC